ncbi:MAG: Protein serine phosphatase with sensor(S) [Acidimicrobiales bacterium]|nr:Protein serine phosphatase with sensor(S) [Acidimicrobiales bacterium]
MAARTDPLVADPWAILESLNDAVVVADRSNRIVYANPAIERMLGWPPHQLVGQPVTDLVPERLRGAHLDGFGRFFDTGIGQVLGQPIRVAARTAAGTERPVELVLSATDSALEPMVMATMRDVAGRLDLERDTALAHEVLRAAAEAETVDGLADRLLTGLGGALDMVAAGLWAPAVGGSFLVNVAWWQPPGRPGTSLAALTATTAFGWGEGLPGSVWATGEPTWISDLARADAIVRRDAALADGCRSAFAFPLTVDDEIVAVIELFRDEEAEPDEGLLRTMRGIGRQAGEVWQRRQIGERLKEVADRERRVAETLQRALLPPALPTLPGVDVAVRFRPGGDLVIGGDFYDLFRLFRDDGPARWGLQVGDVCGTGPEAAAITAKMRFSTRALMRTGRPLARIHDYLNEALAERGDGRFCTCVSAVVTPHPERIELELCNAGHPPPLVRRADGSVVRIDEHGMALGIVTPIEYRTRLVTLARGDSVVLYTDGVTEARRSREQFGESRLADLVAEAGGHGADALADAVLDRVTAHGDRASRDDLVVLVLQFDGLVDPV